jgi:hypothetical protein
MLAWRGAELHLRQRVRSGRKRFLAEGTGNVSSLELNSFEYGRGCVSGMIMEDPTRLGLSFTDNVMNPARFGI